MAYETDYREMPNAGAYLMNNYFCPFHAKKLKITTSSVKLIIASALLLLIAHTNAQKETSAEEKFRPLVEDEAFATLNLDSVKWQHPDRVLLPNEDLEHTQGVFRAYEVNLPTAYWGDWPSVACFSNSLVRVVDTRQGQHSEQNLRSIASEYLAKHFPKEWAILQKGEPFTTNPIQQLPYKSGIYEFGWRFISELEDWYCEGRVQVRAIDGKAVGFRVFKGHWPEHKITRTEAEKSVRQCLARYQLKILKVQVGTLDRAVKAPKTVWRVGVTAKDEKNNSILQVKGGLFADAQTGEVMNCETLDWQPINDEMLVKPTFEPVIVAPSWSKQGLTYVSVSSLAGLPDWAATRPQTFLRDTKGQIHYLTSDLESGSFATSALNTGSWFAIQRQRWTYALNLETGAYRILGMPERAGETPTIDPDGKWAIVSGTGRDRNTDMDLLPDDLSTRGELLGNRGRLVSKGDDHHPLFSPDNKWLYFVTSSEANGKVTQALRRIPAELAHTKEVVTLKPTQIETIIPNFAGQVLRLSLFPNGQKLLLQTEKEMLVLSITDKKATPLAPKNLKDAEVNAPITQTRDGWAGPSDNEVTFSGKTTDKDGKIRWRIYSCRFDGSGLKAWTPKENQPVEAYKFPDAPDGKTAIDLAKQWALKEVEFEDYLKRQGG